MKSGTNFCEFKAECLHDIHFLAFLTEFKPFYSYSSLSVCVKASTRYAEPPISLVEADGVARERMKHVPSLPEDVTLLLFKRRQVVADSSSGCRRR